MWLVWGNCGGGILGWPRWARPGRKLTAGTDLEARVAGWLRRQQFGWPAASDVFAVRDDLSPLLTASAGEMGPARVTGPLTDFAALDMPRKVVPAGITEFVLTPIVAPVVDLFHVVA